jgi:PAS domain S-box-containing protein
VNQLQFPPFPYSTSTRLYPQWAFVVLPHVSEKLSRKVATVLLSMEFVQQTSGMHGFTIPADYSSVENLLRALRLPPFDKTPSFTLHDIWHQYLRQIIFTILVSVIILSLVLRMIVINRKLKESELRYRTVADYTSDWEYWQSPSGNFLYMSPSCEQVCGYTAEEFYLDPQLLTKTIHPDDLDNYLNHTHHLDENDNLQVIDFRIIARDGGERWISHICRPVTTEEGKPLGRRVSNRDITQRKLVQQQLSYKIIELEASIAKIRLLEGIIPICMCCKKIRDDKESWQQLEEYISEHSEATFSHGICPECYTEEMKKINLMLDNTTEEI